MTKERELIVIPNIHYFLPNVKRPFKQLKLFITL